MSLFNKKTANFPLQLFVFDRIPTVYVVSMSCPTFSYILTSHKTSHATTNLLRYNTFIPTIFTNNSPYGLNNGRNKQFKRQRQSAI